MVWAVGEQQNGYMGQEAEWGRRQLYSGWRRFQPEAVVWVKNGKGVIE
jgi:hypothetical protein